MHPQRLSRMRNREQTDYLLMVPKIRKSCLSALEAICGDSEVEAVPLGSKIDVLPGTNMHLYMNNLGDRLHHKECDFDRTIPPDIYISNTYRCLHDQHLRDYFYNQELLDKLKKRHFIKTDNRVVATLKEYNMHRDYLKFLTIKYLTKDFRTKYVQHSSDYYCDYKEAMEEWTRSPQNPINARINRAREAREEMDRIREKRGRKIMRKAQVESEIRVARERYLKKKKVEDEMKRERMREKKLKNKAIRMHKEELMKKEVFRLMFKEEAFRIKEIEEKKRIKLLESGRNFALDRERKKRFKLMKLAEFRRMLEEEEEMRQHNVEEWQKYFNMRVEKLQRMIREALARDTMLRTAEEQKIMESLERRGWNELRHYKPDEYWRQVKRDRKKGKIPGKKKKKKAKGSPASPVISPTLSESSSTLQSSVDESIRREEITSAKSSWLVHKAIEISKTVLLPLLQSYEERNQTKVSDIDVPLLLKDLYPGVPRQPSQQREQLVADSHFPVAETKFPDVPMLRFELKSIESQFLLEDTINELSRRVAMQMIKTAKSPTHLKKLRENLARRIAILAIAVVNEIMAFGMSAAAKASTATPTTTEAISSTTEAISSTTTGATSVVKPADRRLSALTKIMIDEVYGYSEAGIDVGSVIRDGRKLSKEISDLAHYVAHSALHEAASPGDATTPTDEEFFQRITPMVNNLSFRIVHEIMKDRAIKIEDERTSYMMLEHKISKLAFSVVDSVLHGRAVKASPSVTSVASETSDEGPSMDDVIEAIVMLQDDFERPQEIHELLGESQLKRISMRVARKTTPACDNSTSVVSAILMLASALAEDTLTRIQGATGPTLSLSIGNAIKILAEAVVNNAMQHSTKKEPIITFQKEGSSSSFESSDDRSGISGGVSELAGHVVANALSTQATKAPTNTNQAPVSEATSDLGLVVVGKTLSLHPRRTKSSVSQSGSQSDGSTAASDTGSVVATNILTSQTTTEGGTSAVSSAMSELAKHVVTTTLQPEISVTPDVGVSTVSSAMSELAEHVVTITLQPALPAVTESGASAMSSAMSHLAEHVVDATLHPGVPTPEGDPSAESSPMSDGDVSTLQPVAESTTPESGASAVSSAMSDLAEHMVATTLHPGVTFIPNVGSSAVSSAMSELAKHLVTSTPQSTSCSSGNDSSTGASSAISALAQQQASPSSRNTESAADSAVSELAGNVVKTNLNQQGSSSSGDTESAVDSAVSGLASNLVATTLNQQEPSVESTSSAFSAAVSELAEHLVAMTLGLSSEESSTQLPTSEFSSALSTLAENLVVPTLKQNIEESRKPRERRPTTSAFSSAVSQLAENVIKFTVDQIEKSGGQMASKPFPKDDIIDRASRNFAQIMAALIDEFGALLGGPNTATFDDKSPSLEAAVRGAVNNVVVEVVAKTVVNQVKAKCESPLSKSSLAKLKAEVVHIVQNLFRPVGKETTKKLSTTSSVLTSSGRSTLSSVASSIAENVLKQLLGDPKIKLKPVPEYSTVGFQEPKMENLEINIGKAVENFKKNLASMEIDKQTITNMEQSLNTAANKAVASAIASKAFERAQARSHSYINEEEEKKIKDEITTTVLKMMQGKKRPTSRTPSRLQVPSKKGKPGKAGKKSTSLSSAASAIAGDLLEQAFDTLSAASLPDDQEKTTGSLSPLLGRKQQSSRSLKLKMERLKQGAVYKPNLIDDILSTDDEFEYVAMSKRFKSTLDMIYHTSFYDWRKHLKRMYGGVKPVFEYTEDDQAIDMREELSASKSPSMAAMLDDLTTQVVNNVTEHRLISQRDIGVVRSSESTQSLVEDVALEIVVALLGVENPTASPSHANPTIGTTIIPKEIRVAMPKISTGNSSLLWCYDDIELSDEDDFDDEEILALERSLFALQHPQGDSKDQQLDFLVKHSPRKLPQLSPALPPMNKNVREISQCIESVKRISGEPFRQLAETRKLQQV